jgi:hypothetical protein
MAAGSGVLTLPIARGKRLPKGWVHDIPPMSLGRAGVDHPTIQGDGGTEVRGSTSG